MSFSTYTVVTHTDASKGTGVGVSLQKMGRGHTTAKLVITFRPEIVEGFGWTDKEQLEIALGEDEHHGLLRLRKSDAGTGTLTYQMAGDGRGRGGPFYRLNLGHVSLFVDRGEVKRWTMFEALDDGWVEIVLPSWADETGPKARTERPKMSAGVPAIAPPSKPTGRQLTSRLMGDPDPSRSALAQRGKIRPGEITKGEARRRAEQKEAPEHAAAEAESWNRRAAADNRLADLMQVFGLTKSEAGVLRELLDGKLKTRDALHAAAYGLDPTGGPDPKIIDVYLSKMRTKLRTRMVEIETVRGQGFRMGHPMVARVMVLLGETGPSRDDDEAELARLAAEAGEDA